MIDNFLCLFSSLKAEEPTDNHLNPLKVLHCLEDQLSDNAILVADGGDFVATAAYILRLVNIDSSTTVHRCTDTAHFSSV